MKTLPAMPQPTVDIPRYMGDWFVIASIASFLEKDAFNAVENYQLANDGSIKTTFTCRKGAFDGSQRIIHARAFVQDPASHAVWGMQFLWPIKADYRIAWLAPDYSQVVVAREKRDYVWIMARTPVIPESDLRRLTEFAASLGYEENRIQRVPQQDLPSRLH